MLAHSDSSEYVQRRGASLPNAATIAAGSAVGGGACGGAAVVSVPSSAAGRRSSPVPASTASKSGHTPPSSSPSAPAAATITTTTSAVHDHARYADPEIIAMASSSAAVLTKSVLHPLDTLKCRVQLLRTDVLPPHANLRTWRGRLHTRFRQLRHQYTGQWGPRYMYGGLPVKLVFYVPYQALYLSSYNYGQLVLQGKEDERQGVEAGTQRGTSYLWHTIGAAIFAEVASCCLRVPMETMKMRVQSAATAGSLHAMVQLWRQGLRSNMRLLVPHTIMHDIPYSIIQWVVYETLRPWTQQWNAKLAQQRQPEGCVGDEGTALPSSFLSRYGAELARTFLSGGFSGMLASALTVPLDNIRTRTVVATASDPKLTVGKVVRVAYQREGLRGFVRGGGMRVLWVTTNMACFYPLFEGIRSILQSRVDATKTLH